MRILRRRRAVLSVVVPVYNVAAYLAESLDSLLVQTWQAFDVVIVDDGSTDGSGDLADGYAARDRRVRVVHTQNHGLGAARNEGIRHVRGEYVAFLDSDDVLPPDAYATLVEALEASGSDFVTGSIVRWEADGLHEPRWMHRLHSPARSGTSANEHPEILGDVFAWNKVFRRSFWSAAELAWPEGVRYEDQPTLTAAYLRGRFDVRPEIVYHWRIRDDGSSITQQRALLTDLTDRVVTKRQSLATVRAEGSPAVESMFVERVLAGDMWRYFLEIPGCPDDWWDLLRSAVLEFWGDRPLVHSGLPPVHRLTGWLVEQGRRTDAEAVMSYVAEHRAVPRCLDDHGTRRLDLAAIAPHVDPESVPAQALELRPHER
ncbi:MAG: glycosyltransferase [Propionibacteriales bacterium]|nr:glycosyltransferase [Propionibacteriales bacterium]